jgi:dephospho-CoA kinase
VSGPAAIPFVGLTGAMGAGKSSALEALARLGAATLSTDRVVHDLYERPDVIGAVVERWGDGVAPGGVIDRAQVARHAFAEPGERAWLEGLLWPLVGAEVQSFREESGAASPPPVAMVVETPLLFEAGMESAYDATIVVVTEEQLRRERAAARGHEAVDERHDRQLSQEEKAERATYVVANDGSLEDLEAALAGVLAKLAQ